VTTAYFNWELVKSKNVSVPTCVHDGLLRFWQGTSIKDRMGDVQLFVFSPNRIEK